MLVKNLDIAEVSASNFDHQHRKIKLTFTFTNDMPIARDVVIQKNMQPTIDALFTWIKQEKKPTEDQNDDILSGVIIINIVDDDDVREKIAQGLFRVYQKLENVNHITTAREYMQTFNQLKTAQEIVYRKKNA